MRLGRDDAAREIFPGGHLPIPWGRFPRGVREYAETTGFAVTRIHPLRLHYAKTLDHWAAALRGCAHPLPGRAHRRHAVHLCQGGAPEPLGRACSPLRGSVTHDC
ncbi:class I SAM-dependent methyltransferase [Nocardia brasiliensis]|uniref:class I SAM-dependent methyltransferase n=1 Tax=Nocardia brasiliensis TaxID=37326 RepID=UPI00351A137D